MKYMYKSSHLVH